MSRWIARDSQVCFLRSFVTKWLTCVWLRACRKMSRTTSSLCIVTSRSQVFISRKHNDPRIYFAKAQLSSDARFREITLNFWEWNLTPRKVIVASVRKSEFHFTPSRNEFSKRSTLMINISLGEAQRLSTAQKLQSQCCNIITILQRLFLQRCCIFCAVWNTFLAKFVQKQIGT